MTAEGFKRKAERGDYDEVGGRGESDVNVYM